MPGDRPGSIGADLHLHSHYSDGLLTPAQMVDGAVEAGLAAMALTDHDTLDGLPEATRHVPPGVEFLPGVELSCVYRGREIHLLAYGVDPGDEDLRAFLAGFQQKRRERAARMVSRLERQGIPMTYDELLAIAAESGPGGGTSLGRPHVAEALVRHGAAVDIDDAFRKYLRRGKPGWVSKACIPAVDAIALVHSRAAVIVIAHPALNLAETELVRLVGEGLDGIEVWHPKHAPGQVRRLEALARQAGVIPTGGSDYHGPGRTKHEIGSSGVPSSTVEALREAARNYE